MSSSKQQVRIVFGKSQAYCKASVRLSICSFDLPLDIAQFLSKNLTNCYTVKPFLSNLFLRQIEKGQYLPNRRSVGTQISCEASQDVQLHLKFGPVRKTLSYFYSGSLETRAIQESEQHWIDKFKQINSFMRASKQFSVVSDQFSIYQQVAG